jgi:hypothetical protein
MVIGRGGNWAKWLGGEMAKGRIGYGHWAKWEYTARTVDEEKASEDSGRRAVVV